MKIVRIITRLNVGGPALQVLELAKLPVNTYILTGLVESGESDILQNLPQFPRNLLTIPSLRRSPTLRQTGAALRDVTRLLKEIKPDVVHTHTSMAGLIGRIAAWWTGVPLIVHTYHGHTFYGYWSRPVTLAVGLIEHLLGCITDTIITISPKQRTEIERYIGHKNKTIVIRNGFDLSMFDNNITKIEARQKLCWPISARIYGFIGRLAPVKNVQSFINMAERLRPINRHAWFVIVGEGPESDKVPNWIWHQKHVRRDNMPLVYKALDVLVLTSKNEGTPTTILEAKVSGCKVLSTEVGGVEDVIRLTKEEVLSMYDAGKLRKNVLQVYRRNL